MTYQKAYVIKLLSISLAYGNVLYCIDNETSGKEEWATFWAEFIRENSQGKDIYITQMWDNWDVKSDTHKRTLDHPERYRYIDISQNSQTPGYKNWENAQYVFNYIKDNPRPVNSTKIYGSDTHEPWLSRGMTTEHAVSTFCRNILGGFASSRFHRPPHILGLSQHSINIIKTIRKIEERVKMWDIEPRMDLLTDVEENEAYLSANEGKYYLVFFPNGGKVNLDLSNYKDQFNVRWITAEDAKWGEMTVSKGGNLVVLESNNEEACFALVMKK